MYRPHHMYSFPEATNIALAPLAHFVEMVGSSHPEAATVGHAVINQCRAELHAIGLGLSGLCAMPSGLVYTGFGWENERCKMCGKAGCALTA